VNSSQDTNNFGISQTELSLTIRARMGTKRGRTTFVIRPQLPFTSHLMKPEDAAELTLILCAALAVVGLLALLATFIYWRSVGKYVGEATGKVAVEIVQGLALLATLGTGFAATDKRDIWFRPAVAAGACVVIWKVLQVVLDARRKAVEANLKTEAEGYRRQAATYARLIGVLCASVQRKVSRLRKAVKRRSGAPPRIEHVRSALTPHPHLEDLLDAVGSFFCDQLPESESRVRGFRVGVYIAQNGVMVPVHGVHTRDPGNNPFTSAATHPERFRLDAAQPAHVVRAAEQRGMIVVEDCESAADAGQFVFFTEAQRGYLKSIVSYPLGMIQVDATTMTPAVLVIDTDAPGFFKDSERESLRYFLHEFGVRIRLELLLLALVERQGSSRDHKADDADREEGGKG
jgi:hypothetical protein